MKLIQMVGRQSLCNIPSSPNPFPKYQSKGTNPFPTCLRISHSTRRGGRCESHSRRRI